MAGSASTKPVRRLLVVSHVPHYRYGGRLYAYGPYAREIDIWADIFPQVMIASPCRDHQQPPGDCIAFTRPNISILPQVETGGITLRAKLRQLAMLPVVVWRLCRAMRKADAIHVRCPGNLGLLGAVLAPLFSRYLVAKYAGQWNRHPGERWPVRLQRAILRSRWWHGITTVYGEWSNQPDGVIPFFTSMMTSEMVDQATRIAENKTFGRPLRVLFSGALEPRKRVDSLIDAVRIARDRGVDLEVAIVGGGERAEALRQQVERLGLERTVRFTGALPFEEAIAWNEWAHCLVLPSINSEGWPKVVAEGMCYGVVCIAVAHGQIPRMLSQRGILLESGTPEEIAEALEDVARRPEEFQAMARSASVWSRQYSLEGLRDSLRTTLGAHWAVPVG